MTDDLEKSLRDNLRESEARLDPSTRARLAGARQRALEQAHRLDEPRAGWRWTAMAAGLAIAAVTVFTYGPDRKPPAMSDAAQIEPLLLAAAEPEDVTGQDVELYEDLDFYVWLTVEETSG